MPSLAVAFLILAYASKQEVNNNQTAPFLLRRLRPSLALRCALAELYNCAAGYKATGEQGNRGTGHKGNRGEQRLVLISALSLL